MDDDHDIQDESEGDEEMLDDQDQRYMDHDIDIASEADFEPMDNHLVDNAFIPRMPNDDGESDAYEYAHDRQDEDEPAFHMIDLDENPFEDRMNVNDRNMAHHRNQLEAHDDIEQELGEMGFYEFVNFLRRRERPYGGGNLFLRNHRRGYDMNHGYRHGRVTRTNLESLFSIDRNNNDEDFWNSNIVNHPVASNRNRLQIPSDEFSDPRNGISGIIARDMNQLHNRIASNPFSNLRNQRERERNPESKASNNPFDILK